MSPKYPPVETAFRSSEHQQSPDAPAATLRIGEVAKLAGLTTRTLRYWEELGLISPSAYRGSGERLYSTVEANRAARIRELQDLLGFSLAEVRIVLETEDVFDGLRSVYQGDPSDSRLLEMIDHAIDANDRLISRLDDTLVRIHAFRNERASKAERLRAGRAELADQARSGRAPSRERATPR
jgi:DNA-binding transcriptional MerR regulator